MSQAISTKLGENFTHSVKLLNHEEGKNHAGEGSRKGRDAPSPWQPLFKPAEKPHLPLSSTFLTDSFCSINWLPVFKQILPRSYSTLYLLYYHVLLYNQNIMEMLMDSALIASYTGGTKDRMWPFAVTLSVRGSASAWPCSVVRIFAGEIVFLHIFLWMLNILF